MNLTVSPHIAVVVSFFPEHLDYHGTIEEYRDAKAHIARFQTTQDIIFYNAESDGAKSIAEESKGKKIPFTKEESSVSIEETKLLGSHNLTNIAAASMIAKHLGIDEQTIVKAVEDFEGLPHRLQKISEAHGITWIDDAISTTPESAIAALYALGDNVSTLILGGQDRGNDFTELANRIKHSNVKHVILLGESVGRIRNALETAQVECELRDVSTMEEAVQLAKEVTKGTCLLSPASPSYDMFRSFEEKGEKFKEEIAKS